MNMMKNIDSKMVDSPAKAINVVKAKYIFFLDLT